MKVTSEGGAIHLDDLPVSHIMFPKRLIDRIKYIFWRIYRPFHTILRDGTLALGLIRHEGRQNFLVGHLRKDKTIPQLVDHLISRGFGNHFIAWVDEGEMVGLRLLESFDRQYHIRIFQDGEVRGHYEYTPESHIIWHMKETDMEFRKDVFLNFLRDWVSE